MTACELKLVEEGDNWVSLEYSTHNSETATN